MLYVLAPTIVLVLSTAIFQPSSCSTTADLGSLDNQLQTDDLLDTRDTIVGPAAFLAGTRRFIGPRKSKVYYPSFKYNALLQIRFANKITEAIHERLYVCTGSLITKSHVLTAAHCCKRFERFWYVHGIYVTIGETLLHSNTSVVGGGWPSQYVMHEQLWVPPGYLVNTASPPAFRPDLKWDFCIIRLPANASETPALRGKPSKA